MVAKLPNSYGIEAEGELFRVRVSDSAQPLKRFITGCILIRRTDRGRSPGSRMEGPGVTQPFPIQALTTRLA
jgi:hypothetical protein